MADQTPQQMQVRFGIGLGIGLVVAILISIFSPLVGPTLFIPVIIIGFISGIIRPFIHDWSEILSFAGGHFLIQWLIYSIFNIANWKMAAIYAAIAAIACLIGQVALNAKKK